MLCRIFSSLQPVRLFLIKTRQYEEAHEETQGMNWWNQSEILMIPLHPIYYTLIKAFRKKPPCSSSHDAKLDNFLHEFCNMIVMKSLELCHQLASPWRNVLICKTISKDSTTKKHWTQYHTIRSWALHKWIQKNVKLHILDDGFPSSSENYLLLVVQTQGRKT